MKSKFVKNTLAVCAAIFMLGACVTATPYQAASGGINSYGYQDTKLETGKHRVSFRGNTNTDRATVENFVLLRAAELTLQDGLGHCVIIDEDEGGRRNFNSTGFNSGFGRGFGSRRGFGGGFGGTTTNRTRERRIFDVSVIVQGFPGEKSSENFEAFNASEIVANLGGRAG